MLRFDFESLREHQIEEEIIENEIMKKQIKISKNRKSLEIHSSEGGSPVQTLSFTRSESIQSACFASFYLDCDTLLTTRPHRSHLHVALVVLTEDFIRFYFTNGEEYLISIPFTVSAIYPIHDGGIFIERVQEKEGLHGTDLPTLFALFHPSEEIKPVFLYAGDMDTDPDDGMHEGEEMKLIPFLDSFGNVLLVQDNWLISLDKDKSELHIFTLSHRKDSDAQIESVDEDGLVVPTWIKQEMSIISRINLIHQSILFMSSLVDHVYITNDEDGENILWILCKSEKQIIGHNFDSMKKKYQYAVLSSCLVSAHDDKKYLLLLLPDFSLHLWTGRKKLISCYHQFKLKSKERHKRTFSQADTANEVKDDIRERRLVDISSRSKKQVVATFSDGSLGLGQAFYGKQSCLVEACLHALEYTIPSDLYIQFYSRFIKVFIDTKRSMMDEWESFIICFFSFLHERLSSVTMLKQRDSEKKLTDTFEDRLAKFNESLPACVQNNINSHQPKDGTKMKFLFRASKSLHLKFHNEENLRKYFEHIFMAFHLVYEDLILDSALMESVSLLGKFLYQLSISIVNSMALYYRGNHHGPASFDLQFENIPETLLISNRPVKILEWIHDCIKHSKVYHDPLDQLNRIGKQNPLLFKGLDRIRFVYRIFSELLADNGKIELVKFLSDTPHLVELERLPIAVSLPIKQAIFECKKDPRSLFANRKAYELIGRLDLAALVDQKGIKQCRVKNGADEISQLLFSIDDRVKQVQEIFQPSVEEVLEVAINPSMSIEEIGAAQQAALAIWANKPYAYSFGKGMFEFNSADIIPTEVFPIPQLIKAARVPPLNSLIELLVPPESDALEWPEFHSGVASALKIKRNCPDLNSSWIVFNQSKSADGPNQIDSAHAGFIFGLGLLGHLKKLDSADSLRNYFLPGFEILSVGHLLGLAAAHLGSRNTQITNMVSVHLPSMLPAHSVELSSGSILKAGAIVGYGLLHFQHPTQYKLDKVLKELESFSFSENSIENAGNESYMNACGFALGFIGLGKGTAKFAVTESTINRLLKLLAKPISFSSSISVVVALGLLCLKSNNDLIAKQLEIPKSEFLLNWITPELLLIRTISKYLIMWDEVQPTQVWLEAQIPNFLLDIVTTHSFKFTPIHEHAFHCYHASVAGLTFVIGLKYASSYCQDAYDCLFYYYHQTTQAITSLGNVNIAAKYGFSQKLFHTIARMCTNTIISSLSLVMAGSGNKKLFSMLKTIQAQSGPDISYGSHMCVNMSIGLLFLSKGMGSLGTSDKAIAALFCSFFPLYPLCSSDNRSHLQALRHLWVLAFEDRCLITRDVDNGDAVCVPVQIVLHDDTILNEFSPFNIPDKSQIKSIQIKGPRYWDIVLPIHSINNENTIWVQRKTKYLSYTQDPDGRRGILSASFPDHSSKSRNFNFQKMRERFFSLFSHSPEVLAFVQTFCNSNEEETSDFSIFCIQILYDCICKDQLDFIQTYMAIYNLASKFMPSSVYSPTNNDGLLIACITSFFKDFQFKSIDNEEDRLDAVIDEFFLDSLQECHSIFISTMERSTLLITYAKTGELALLQSVSEMEICKLCSCIAYKRWPDAFHFPAIQNEIHTFLKRDWNPFSIMLLMRNKYPNLDDIFFR